MEPDDVRRARKYLLSQERVIEVVQWHWIWLAKPVAVGLAVLVPLAALGLNLPLDSDALPVVLWVMAAALAWLAWNVYEWHVERLIVTDRRIMLVTGVLARRVAMMPLRKVTDMTFERPFWGRVLGAWGWGTFVLESAGQDQALHRISPLPHPEALYRCISTEIFYGARTGAPSDADDGTGSGDDDSAPAREQSRRRTPERTDPDPSPALDDTGPIERPWWDPEVPEEETPEAGSPEPLDRDRNRK